MCYWIIKTLVVLVVYVGWSSRNTHTIIIIIYNNKIDSMFWLNLILFPFLWPLNRRQEAILSNSTVGLLNCFLFKVCELYKKRYKKEKFFVWYYSSRIVIYNANIHIRILLLWIVQPPIKYVLSFFKFKPSFAPKQRFFPYQHKANRWHIYSKCN